MDISTTSAPEAGDSAVFGPGLSGALGAGLSLGLAELFAGLFSSVPSAVSSVGAWVGDVTPTPIERWAIETFGTADKAVLAVGTALIALGLGALAGRASVTRRWILVLAFGGFASVGVVAGWSGTIRASAFARSTSASAEAEIESYTSRPCSSSSTRISG